MHARGNVRCSARCLCIAPRSRQHRQLARLALRFCACLATRLTRPRRHDPARHEGPVWQVAWAHPSFGSLLASCSYDRRVIIWKESGTRQWTRLYEHRVHASSVNAIAWAPPHNEYAYGAGDGNGPLVLACASADGKVSILWTRGDGTWDSTDRVAHQLGCNAVSWAPTFDASGVLLRRDSAAPSHDSSAGPGTQHSPTVAPAQESQQPRGQLHQRYRLVTGGCDNYVRTWIFDGTELAPEHALQAHTDWVRDVAWAPNIGLPGSTMASAGQDGCVYIWTQERPEADWLPRLLSNFPDAVWRVSWSMAGTILAVASGDNKVSLWKEAVDGSWSCISDMDAVGPDDSRPPLAAADSVPADQARLTAAQQQLQLQQQQQQF